MFLCIAPIHTKPIQITLSAFQQLNYAEILKILRNSPLRVKNMKSSWLFWMCSNCNKLQSWPPCKLPFLSDCPRCYNVYDVGVDHLVAVQCVVRAGHALQGALCKAISRRWFHLHSAHWGDRAVHSQWGLLWVRRFFISSLLNSCL